MPHRVATFFRSHSNSFDPSVQDNKKKTSRSFSALTAGKSIIGDRSTISSSSSISSADSIISMPDSHKRLSMNGVLSVPQHSAARLGVEIESPPLVFYGPPARSSGALLSGQLKLSICDDNLDIESFRMDFVVDQKMKKPFQAHCDECANHSTGLNTWNFLQCPLTLQRGRCCVWTNKILCFRRADVVIGEHDFPFSFLLPGHLPATMHGSLSSVEYVLKAVITPKTGGSITLTKELDVKRAIQPAEVPRQSIRIFPPTNLTAVMDLPAVMHPIGEFQACLRLDGIIRRNPETKNQTHWKLKRVNWRLEETQKVISPACQKHALKAGAGPDEKKGIAHQDVRILNAGELKSGWKADYSAADGSIEMEFSYSLRNDVPAICDIKAHDGTEVTHSLVVELIVAEEIAPIRRPTQCTPTGAARVLRMHFTTVLTERSGLGISWDEEQPPLYENVPASPPRYGNVGVYEGVPIPDYEELDRLQSE
jgi:arrestin-related trafficking adapter 1